MKTFILGGKGFVGSAFARFCARQEKDYRVVDLDNYEQMKGEACGLLINADGNSKKFLADENPVEDFRLSVLSVLQSLEDFKSKKYVLISSIDVYPDHSHPEKNREDTAIDTECLSRYGFHKYLSELLVKYYASSWIIVRLGGVLGPGLRKNPVFDLLNDVPLRTSEESRFQYLTTDAVAEIVFKLVEKGRWGEVFNICGTGTVTLREIRSWLNKPLCYFQERVPRERYEVNTEKIDQFFTLPDSREVARKFVLSEGSQSKIIY